MDMFSCLVHHLDRVGSDHAPLLVECKSHECPPARPFTFLNVWTEHEDFQRVVADSWREDIAGSPMFVFGAKLKRLAHSLKRWNRDTFGHIFDRLKVLEQDVRDIELQLQIDPSNGTFIEFKRRSALLKRQYRIEDEFWRQKAHAKWVTDGERNSGYFHSVVKDRQRKLYIHRIQDDRGQWVTERAAIATQAITFFQAMFSADPSVTSSALDMIPRLVTDEDNDRLWWNFRTQGSIWTAFMRAKYCSRVHPVSKQRLDDDSHTWKRMLDVRENLTWERRRVRVSSQKEGRDEERERERRIEKTREETVEGNRESWVGKDKILVQTRGERRTSDFWIVDLREFIHTLCNALETGLGILTF
ncbi:hypothetical protein DM860_016723 [Cuscuta australis]|uniref:Uncharacterized protein n=1 Tax=Cuscuta australis TaxID=267555 RepID=A0A328DM04_9ASTE|nr:hypothetical protein DM860_016723 [Cuscuta australis]